MWDNILCGATVFVRSKIHSKTQFSFSWDYKQTFRMKNIFFWTASRALLRLTLEDLALLLSSWHQVQGTFQSSRAGEAENTQQTPQWVPQRSQVCNLPQFILRNTLLGEKSWSQAKLFWCFSPKGKEMHPRHFHSAAGIWRWQGWQARPGIIFSEARPSLNII